MAQRTQNGQKGGAKINLVITLMIMAAMIFTAVKVVPVYFANYQFQDALNSESRFALTGYPKRTIEDVRDDIYRKAQELQIPAKREDIQVSMQNGAVNISLDYAVPIDLSVYQFTLQFHPHADNHSI
jgi:hypothetical protein